MDYFNDKEYLSNSMVSRLLEDRNLFTKWMNGEYHYPATKDVHIGTLVHWGYQSSILKGRVDDDAPTIKIVDDLNLRTNKGKELKKQYDEEHPDNWLIKSDKMIADDCVEALLKDKAATDYIEYYLNEYASRAEVVYTKTIMVEYGDHDIEVPLKGRPDIVFRDEYGTIVKVIDLKTTYEIKRFKPSAWKFGYPRQAVHYSKITDTDLSTGVFDFLVVGKGDLQVKVFETDRPEFVKNATESFWDGIDSFLAWANGDIVKLIYTKL